MYRDRYAKACDLMEKMKLGGLFISGEENVFYFTGLRIFSAWTSYPRPNFVFLPLHGEPIFLVQENHVEHARLASWIKNLRYYGELTGPPTSAIVEILRNAFGGDAKIGAELGYEQRINMPVQTFLQVQKQSGLQFLDASKLLCRMRMVKSQEEVGCIKTACEILGKAYDETFGQLKPGTTETELAIALRTAICKFGSERPAFLTMSSASDDDNKESSNGQDNRRSDGMVIHTKALMSRLPREGVILNNSDIVWIDSGAVFKGYNSDYSRMVSLGRPSDRQVRMYKLTQKITGDCIRAMRPGTKCSDVVRFCNQRMKEAGLNIVFDRGRIGHGLGLLLTEPPHIGLYDQTVIEPNMVLTIEPGIITDYGSFHLEENVLIRESGEPEILSVPVESFKTES